MLLETKDIKLNFSSSKKKGFNLLNGVDMTVPEGKITALIGGNGAGKTTLFNIISGYEKNFQGQVFLDGRDISHLPAFRISRMGIGRLFQGYQLSGELSLMDNMKIADSGNNGISIKDIFKAKRIEKIRESMAYDILDSFFGKGNKYIFQSEDKASKFSYGEQRLIALSRLMMGNNSLLLLDEPTSGVNPKYFDIIRKMIRNMEEDTGKTVLLIEHNMSFVRSVADWCHYLADGRIVKSGPVNELLDDPDIRNNYLGI